MEVIVLAVAGGVSVSFGLGWCIKKVYDHLKVVNSIREIESEGWTHIGTVKFICIYPIDGGRGMKLDIANFGRYGLQTLPDPSDHTNKVDYDRGFIIFNQDVRPPKAIFNDPHICTKSDKDEEISMLWHTLKLVATTCNMICNTRDIQYLNREIKVQVPAKTVIQKIKSAYNIQANTSYEVGFFSQLRRINFNEDTRHELELYGDPDCHLSNFSSCTMVNSKSIKDLKNATGRSDLSYKNFRPQIVFKGKRRYIEENVRALKIGNLEFHNVRPCTHDENININYEQEDNQNSYFRMLYGGRDDPSASRMEPFDYLSRYRPLSRTGSAAYQNSSDPVFGLNFHLEEPELVEDNIEMIDVRAREDPGFYNIISGHQVYARYNLPREHPQAEDEIAL